MRLWQLTTTFQFQSTPPARGATSGFRLGFGVRVNISIHAPREGGDAVWGELCDDIVKISIHAPREGGDKRWVKTATALLIFQSTPPARGATFAAMAVDNDFSISIHAPREGGDDRQCADQPAA